MELKEELTVTISKKEYEALLEDSRWLQCLQYAGVDNWIGFEYALEAYEKLEK